MEDKSECYANHTVITERKINECRKSFAEKYSEYIIKQH